MPSHLTRQVFRRLLANEPIVHRGCLRRRGIITAAYGGRRQTKASCQDTQTPSAVAAAAQRRAFFDLTMFRKPKTKLKAPDMVAGMDKMRELEKLQRLRARLPSQKEISKAIKAFIAAKVKSDRSLDDIEASLLLRSIQYCRELLITDDNVSIGTTKMWPGLHKVAASHVSLAFELHGMLNESSSPATIRRVHCMLCQTLCHMGDPDRARNLQTAFERTAAARISPNTDPDVSGAEDDAHDTSSHVVSGEEGQLHDCNVRCWTDIISAYARLDRDLEVNLCLELAKQRGLADRSDRLYRSMMFASLHRGNLQEVQTWWGKWYSMVSRNAHGRSMGNFTGEFARSVMELLRWCATSGHISFGHDVVREILQNNPVKPIWDAIFVWAAATGKGVDEIGRMIEVMESAYSSTSSSSKRRQADIATINALVECAISKEDPYMAERFIALGRERGIEPDAKTYVLQIDYRLSVGDIDGALTSYQNLQSTDTTSEEDVPTVNKLIVALCSSKRHDFDTIMNVAADLSDRRARFEPQTVTTLTLLHLDRDEVQDVTDLLNTHAYHFSSAERAGIRDALLAYCLDPQAPLARTWDAYTILREIFDELPRQPRTQLMSLFFRRKRPDIAVHVFNHMRLHSREDTIPTIDTYVTAFMGAARLKDLESLELIHNQLKLDFNINVSTHLRNALIIAYTACGKPRKALSFWDDIVASREGPSYNSIHVAFRACEHAHLGDFKAKEIWAKLWKMNVELDRTLWGSYIAAVAGQGNMSHAVEILAAADKKGELDVDEHVLGSLFMSTPSPVKQRDVEVWARDKYPQVWGSLMEKGVKELENGARVLKGIDRSVAP